MLMTTRAEHAERVATMVEYLDACVADGRMTAGWRGRAVEFIETHRCDLTYAVSNIAGGRPAFYDASQVDRWNLAHGITIDYSALGDPPDDGETPRRWRELRAWAELDAAWWEAFAPC